MTSPLSNCTRLALAAGLLAVPAALHAEPNSEPNEEAAREDAAPIDLPIDHPVIAPDAAVFTLAAAIPIAQQDFVAGPAMVLAAQQSGAPAEQPASGMPKIVFDETWVTIGVGAGLVPSYSGSDDYVAFPLPLIVGRIGGVGIRPNGPGIRLDFLSPAPALGPNQKTTFNFGPTIRLRNDRAQQIEDEVVELAEDLDVALEVGLAGGVTFPGVINAFDSLTFNTQVRWDVLGAHEGMLVEPSIGYQTPFGTGVLFQTSFGAQFVDDSFADYYYTVTPAQSTATGLPQFDAQGGLNNLSVTSIVNFDLDGNALNGGLSVYMIAGYTRLMNDAAATPYTDLRGSADQFIAGAGIAYTF